jgi:predicted RNA binding protein YcfA (HicA-like mRNA interferase family)
LSKKDKRIQKLFSNPAPKDFTWAELIALMDSNSFKNECSGGSHYIFEHTCGLKLIISKTHPSGILKPYQIKAVKHAFTQIGITE